MYRHYPPRVTHFKVSCYCTCVASRVRKSGRRILSCAPSLHPSRSHCSLRVTLNIALNYKNLLSAYYIIVVLAPTNTCSIELFLCGKCLLLYIQVLWIGKQVNNLLVHVTFDIIIIVLYKYSFNQRFMLHDSLICIGNILNLFYLLL